MNIKKFYAINLKLLFFFFKKKSKLSLPEYQLSKVLKRVYNGGQYKQYNTPHRTTKIQSRIPTSMLKGKGRKNAYFPRRVKYDFLKDKNLP